MRLLARTTRGVALTEAGDGLARRAQVALESLDAAFDEAARRDGELQGRLRLALPLSFGVAHLARPLADFAAAHPGLELDASYDDRFTDVIAEGFDAAVRIGALADSSLVARRLAPVRGVVMASPDYLARHGTPLRPRDLARHACLVSGKAGSDLWRFREGARWISVRVRARVRADNGDALREAAAAGLGIAALPTFLAIPSLETGAVVPILTGFALPERAIHVVRPPGPATSKVRALIDYLAERFAGEPTWDPCHAATRAPGAAPSA